MFDELNKVELFLLLALRLYGVVMASVILLFSIGVFCLSVTMAILIAVDSLPFYLR